MSGRRKVLLAIGLVVLLPAADWRTPPRGEGPETVAARSVEGVPYLGVNDLARLLDATKFWKPETRQLLLRAGNHSLTLSAENPFVLVDERTVWLPVPIVSREGELQVPVALIESLPRDSSLARLFFDERRNRVIVLPAGGNLGSPRLQVLDEVTRITFPADRPEQALVVARSRAHFRVRFGGVFTGALPESLPSGTLLNGIQPIASAGGSAFEMAVSREAAGYRLTRDEEHGRVTLELFRRDRGDLEAFALEAPEGPRRVQLIVLDPGHGGSDAGVVVGDAREKDLTLRLAMMLREELSRALPARVLLTRTDDRDLPLEQRAEMVNRLRADLVVCLHFDGFVSTAARGATGYCPPATVAGAGEGRDFARGPLALLPWRDVAARHATESRAATEAILSALELRGLGPTRLRERMPSTLLGANAPGLLLECATLTAPDDRERVTQEAGLRELAAAIAQGVIAYQRNL